MLRDHSLREAYLIIDALDECQEGLLQLLDLIIHNASTSRHVKWAVSSRNRYDIEERLRVDDTPMRLSLELNTKHVSLAVEKYIAYEVSQLVSLEDDRTRQEQVRDQMRQ
jgi:hypothetical protein